MKYTYVIVRTALGGMSNNLSKLVMSSIPMYHFLIIRNILMLLLSVFNNKSFKDDLEVIKSDSRVRNSVILSACMSAVSSMFFYQGLKNLPVSIVSSIDNTFSIIAVTVIGLVFFKQRHTKRFYFLLAMLIPSAALLVITDLSGSMEVSPFGLACLVISTSLAATESHLTKRQLLSLTVRGNVVFKTIASLFCVTVMAIISQDSIHLTLEGLSLVVIFMILYGAVNSLIIKLLHTRSIKEIGATVTTVFTSLTPLFSIVFSMIIFHESLQLTQWIGVASTIIVLYLISRLK